MSENDSKKMGPAPKQLESIDPNELEKVSGGWGDDGGGWGDGGGGWGDGGGFGGGDFGFSNGGWGSGGGLGDGGFLRGDCNW